MGVHEQPINTQYSIGIIVFYRPTLECVVLRSGPRNNAYYLGHVKRFYDDDDDDDFISIFAPAFEHHRLRCLSC